MEELIEFETAKLAKENGFDLEENIFPSQSELQTWLREEHNMMISVKPFCGDMDFWTSVFYHYKDGFMHDLSRHRDYTSFESAFEAGLVQALTTIKDTLKQGNPQTTK